MLASIAPRCSNVLGCSTAVPPPQPQPLAPCRRRLPARRSPCGTAAAGGGGGEATPQQRDAASLDVSGTVVTPAYRSTPWAAKAAAAAEGAARAPCRLAFVSESGICRCLLAAAAFEVALQAHGLRGAVEVECRATRDYCLGDGPDASAALVAAELGWALPRDYAVRQFKEAEDIVSFDVVLVVDKFTAADVLREVAVFDTISAMKAWDFGGAATYSSKVRRLGEFAPGFDPTSKDPEAGDIADPLYGNVGGEAELAAVRRAAAGIAAACEGLADFVARVHQQQQQGQQAQQQADGGSSDDGGSDSGGSGCQRLGDAMLAAVRQMAAVDWMVPPMLQAR